MIKLKGPFQGYYKGIKDKIFLLMIMLLFLLREYWEKEVNYLRRGL